jgi:hypothetical protein
MSTAHASTALSAKPSRATRTPRSLPEDRIFTPFTVAFDTREQHPYEFTNLRADADKQNRPLVVRLQAYGLPTGDYSIVGHHDRVAIERKSLADLYGTLGQGRDRFERELERLQAIASQPGGCAAVVIEASWEQMLWRMCPTCNGSGMASITTPCAVCENTGRLHPVEHSRLNPKTVFRSLNAWEIEFPGVHWHPMGSRDMAQVKVFRLLERWWEKVGSQSATAT